ncbi:MAG TPA: hypothetical protein VN890_02960, partial [Methylocella sp.]|nr:hypothetical protein [Methylocella sp.]
MTAALSPAPTSAAAIRGRIVDALRRDLIGPGPKDADLADELLKVKENPSRWYLAGFLSPALDGEGAESLEDEGDPLVGEDEASDPETGGGRAAD